MNSTGIDTLITGDLSLQTPMNSTGIDTLITGEPSLQTPMGHDHARIDPDYNRVCSFQGWNCK